MKKIAMVVAALVLAAPMVSSANAQEEDSVSSNSASANSVPVVRATDHQWPACGCQCAAFKQWRQWLRRL